MLVGFEFVLSLDSNSAFRYFLLKLQSVFIIDLSGIFKAILLKSGTGGLESFNISSPISI